jgi:hypothetical protein
MALPVRQKKWITANTITSQSERIRLQAMLLPILNNILQHRE